MQQTFNGCKKQPTAYFCTKLDNVVQGWPPCYQGVAAAHYAYEKVSVVTMGDPVTILTHTIEELINQGKSVVTQDRCF